MRKLFLLLVGFGGGLTLFLLLVISAAGTGADPWETIPSEASGQAPFGTTRVEYIKPANITFPCQIPGTDLTAERIVLYEGGYLEDNSNEEVVDIAALEVRNRGDKIISSAKITLERDGAVFTFRGSFIPTDCPVLLLETDRKQCLYQNFTDCSGIQSIAQDRWLEDGDLNICPVSMGTIRITNTTEKPMYDIMLFYKNFLPGTDLYVGGITRKQGIAMLNPGDSVEVNPTYFAREYSRILGATATSTPEI